MTELYMVLLDRDGMPEVVANSFGTAVHATATYKEMADWFPSNTFTLCKVTPIKSSAPGVPNVG